jgi:hypothetical protein
MCLQEFDKTAACRRGKHETFSHHCMELLPGVFFASECLAAFAV